MNWELEKTYERRPQRMQVSTTVQVDDRPVNAGCMTETRYILQQRLNFSFWSTELQLQEKRHEAERAIAAHTYKDMIPLVREILLDAADRYTAHNARALLSMMGGN